MPSNRYDIGDTIKLNNKKCIVVRDNTREVCGVSRHSLFNLFMSIENDIRLPEDSSVYLLGGDKDFILKLKRYNFKEMQYKYCKIILIEKSKVY